MLIGIFYSQIVESSSLVSVLFREAISDPYISFFHLLVNGFSVIIISIMNKSQETTFFHGRQKLSSAMKQRPEKCQVDFNFDALYRYVFIEILLKSGLVKKLTGRLY